MKIRKIKIMSAIAFSAMLVFAGCKKDDGPIRSSVGIENVPVISTNIDLTGSLSIDLLNLSKFSGKFTVSNYFPNSVPPTKIDVVVRKNGSATNQKVYKAGVTTYPASFVVTAAEIASLFGTAIVVGDSYDFAPNIYVGDKLYEAFPTTTTLAVGTGAGAAGGMPLFSEYARFAAICAYDPDFYTGAFKAKDAFGDADGATIVLTKVDATHFSFIYPSVDNPKPIIVTVNASTNAVTVPLTLLGTQWSASYGYVPSSSYQNPSLNSGSGSVTPCSRSVTINIQWGVNNGALQFGGGPYQLVLTKP